MTLLNNFSFISEAHAQGAGGAGGSFDILGFAAPLLFLFVVMYFFIIRPQKKKEAEHRQLVSNLRRGDKVITSSGIFGSVFRVVNDTEIEIEIANNVQVRMLKSMVSQVLAKTEPSSSVVNNKPDKKKK
ncbi:preprotein translocase subunit YajC [Candidatus Nucleicultrix amoebiphila]|jgi:preprotein translocase subunit YajC|uniref:Sec translocon accessory complex subunit YajC n=1 Tax=Candidatus Nucleicultrix amoebiphila FS5 TaxID=1414854 RepID=A0A1W6N4C1_9PROT|nr:preprotein translocase subunit YajC [Candidatus Nucleicultrix amoebiphila]ARN84695.1 hypothetical protein GQ61_04545 [Candidatus Nucleicultrix amoebiphila FS5]